MAARWQPDPPVVIALAFGLTALAPALVWSAPSRADWACGLVLTLVSAAQAWVLFPWPQVLSMRVRPLWCGGAVLLAALSVTRLPHLPAWGLDWRVAVALAASIPGAAATVSALRLPPPPRLTLSLPFRAGAYVVMQGGGPGTNHHAVSASQRYATDILALDRRGRSTRPGRPRHVQDYVIYGDPVVAPCAGTVTWVHDGEDDAPPGVLTGFRHSAGNHVVLSPQPGTKVLLAHLRPGSIQVSAGQTVAPGDLIGEVGNSGRSSEPHLHLHAEQGGDPRREGTGTGIPVSFAGYRRLVRNRRLTVRPAATPNRDASMCCQVSWRW